MLTNIQKRLQAASAGRVGPLRKEMAVSSALDNGRACVMLEDVILATFVGDKARGNAELFASAHLDIEYLIDELAKTLAVCTVFADQQKEVKHLQGRVKVLEATLIQLSNRKRYPASVVELVLKGLKN